VGALTVKIANCCNVNVKSLKAYFWIHGDCRI